MILRPETPAIFGPLWTSGARYKGAWGGRGSAKSWDRAQAVTLGMLKTPGYRVACVREVQASIKDSVYQLVFDTIQRLGVGDKFEVLENEIRGPAGSQCIFKGMKDQNAETIKSLEGYDVVWWEEAQTASQRSLDILRPTIRKPGSELWFTWNPRKRTDPVDVLLRQSNLGDMAVVVEAQWSDNPWFPEVLEEERQLDLKGDPDRYAHIWEGGYEAEGDMQFISARTVLDAVKRELEPEITDPLVMGVDVARLGGDKSAIYLRRGRDAVTIPPMTMEKIDTMAVVGKVTEAIGLYAPDAVFVDITGIGAGVVDRLIQLGHNVIGINFASASDRIVQGVPRCANKRAEMWAIMREWLKSGGVIPDRTDLEIDLTAPQYKYDAHNAILLEKKDDMKKRGVRSPDIADALALTFAYPAVARSIQAQLADKAAEEYDPIWGR